MYDTPEEYLKYMQKKLFFICSVLRNSYNHFMFPWGIKIKLHPKL